MYDFFRPTTQIQQVTDDYTHKADEMLKAKTTELTKGV